MLVEARVSSDGIELTDVAAAAPAATLEIQQWRLTDDRVTVFVWARGEEIDRVGDEFATLTCVADVATVSDGESASLYRVTMGPTVEPPPESLLQDAAMLEGYIRQDGIYFTAQVASRNVLRGLWEFLREREITLETKRLRRTTDDDGSDRLTTPQFEALATAYETGYFDESTRVTQSEIADELGISRQSVSERLRRAEQRLVEKQLSHSD